MTTGLRVVSYESKSYKTIVFNLQPNSLKEHALSLSLLDHSIPVGSQAGTSDSESQT